MFMQLQIMVIALLTAVACVLPGIFLVLRGVALMSDAISHAVLLGITIMFLLVHNLESPLLIVGAVCAGLLTVVCTELLIQTKRLGKDTAIGLVFPLFFSIGVILISKYARNVHLDVDMVLLGEIAFAPFNRLIIAGVDCGPYAMWLMGIIVIINSTCIRLFYKELALATFDQQFCHVMGYSPIFIHYGLMTLTSITVVGAFDVVGAIVVVALMITPPATAYLLTNRLNMMIVLSVMLGSIAAIGGYGFAYVFDVSIAGAIAMLTGILFIVVLFMAPEKGILGTSIHNRKQKINLAGEILCTYLLQHETMPIATIASVFGWQGSFTNTILNEVVKNEWVMQEKGTLHLTKAGHVFARWLITERTSQSDIRV